MEFNYVNWIYCTAAASAAKIQRYLGLLLIAVLLQCAWNASANLNGTLYSTGTIIAIINYINYKSIPRSIFFFFYKI